MDKRMPKMSPKSSPAGALIERAIRAIDDGDWAALERCASTLTKYGNIDESAIRAAVNDRGTDLVKLLE
jgi:hypothetical protein